MSVKSLGKQSLIYGAGHIMARSVTFLLLPLYTNILSPQEYGTITLLCAYLGFMVLILHYGLDASFLKYYVPADVEDRKSIVTNVYISLVVTTISYFILMMFFGEYVSRILFSSDLPKLTILTSGILIFDVLLSIHVLILRAESRPVLFTLINILNVISSLSLNIIFVAFLKMGVYGVLISNLITSGIIFFITIPIIMKRISIATISIHQWKKLMKFALPLLLAGIFSMIMELSDRYILLYLTNIETVGLYNAGYKLGLFLVLVIMGFNMAWQPFFLKKNKNEKEYIAKVSTVVLSILGFLWVLLILWSEDLVKIHFGKFTFFGEYYWESTQIVPLIALAYIFHAMYLLQLPGVYFLEKSIWIAGFRGIGAVANIVLNFLLIPQFGIMGAAGATCLSFLIMTILIYIINIKIFPINFEWKKIAIIIFVGGLIWILNNYTQSSHPFIIKIILSIFYPLALASMRIINMKNIFHI